MIHMNRFGRGLSGRGWRDRLGDHARRSTRQQFAGASVVASAIDLDDITFAHSFYFYLCSLVSRVSHFLDSDLLIFYGFEAVTASVICQLLI
jgi:hypothetical protein